jgi:hypothetical protein
VKPIDSTRAIHVAEIRERREKTTVAAAHVRERERPVAEVLADDPRSDLKASPVEFGMPAARRGRGVLVLRELAVQNVVVGLARGGIGEDEPACRAGDDVVFGGQWHGVRQREPLPVEHLRLAAVTDRAGPQRRLDRESPGRDDSRQVRDVGQHGVARIGRHAAVAVGGDREAHPVRAGRLRVVRGVPDEEARRRVQPSLDDEPRGRGGLVAPGRRRVVSCDDAGEASEESQVIEDPSRRRRRLVRDDVESDPGAGQIVEDLHDPRVRPRRLPAIGVVAGAERGLGRVEHHRVRTRQQTSDHVAHRRADQRFDRRQRRARCGSLERRAQA